MKIFLNVFCVCFGVMFHQNKKAVEIPADALNMDVPVSSVVSVFEKNKSFVISENKSTFNYPNPFSSSTTILYNISTPGYVTVTLYDLLGHEVSAYKDGFKSIGETEMKINLSFLNSGVYFYEIRVDGRRQAFSRMTILK